MAPYGGDYDDENIYGGGWSAAEIFSENISLGY
jgi:hypothetical protein